MSSRQRPPSKNRMYAVTKPQGICLIINVRRYTPESHLAERPGSERDVESVRQLFQYLGFEVRVEEDPSGEDIAQLIRSLVAVSQEEMKRHGSFVCFLMCHGSNQSVIGRDGVGQSVADLTSLMDSRACPALAHKPKVFFVHASRSPTRLDNSVAVGEPTVEDEELVAAVAAAQAAEGATASSSFFLRDMDFLVCFANTEGSAVFDDQEHGSAFLQAVCRLVRKQHTYEHLDDIMTNVNRYLKSRPVCLNGRQYYYVPEKVSSLTRQFFIDPDMATAAAAVEGSTGSL